MVRVGFFWLYAFNPLAKNGQWLLYHRVFSWLAFHGFHEGSKTNGKMHAKIIIKCLAPLHILSFLYVNLSWYTIDGKTSSKFFYKFIHRFLNWGPTQYIFGNIFPKKKSKLGPIIYRFLNFRSYLSTIPTYNFHFNSHLNSHFLLSRSIPIFT